MQLSGSRVGIHNNEVFLPEQGDLRWLLSQFSKSCDRIYFVLTNRHMEVVGQDTGEGFILKLGLTGLALSKGLPSFCLRADAKEFRAAISCLSDSRGLKLRFSRDRVEISSPDDDGTVFNVRAILAKPILATRVRYHHRLVLPTRAVLLLTRASRVFPDMIRIAFSTRALQIFELSPSRRMLLSVAMSGAKGRKTEIVVASRHLRRISEILRRSDARVATVSVDSATPVRLAFRFSKLSSVTAVFPMEHQDNSRAITNVQNLPLFKTCPIVQMISFIGARVDGTDPLLISRAGLDTPGSLNLHLAQELGLVSWSNRAVSLTNEGRHLIGLLRHETGSAKVFLHDVVLRNSPLYRKMLSMLTGSPLPFEELKLAAARLQGGEMSQDREELVSSLIGIASWCGVVTRRLGLVYSLKTHLTADEKRLEIPAQMNPNQVWNQLKQDVAKNRHIRVSHQRTWLHRELSSASNIGLRQGSLTVGDTRMESHYLKKKGSLR